MPPDTIPPRSPDTQHATARRSAERFLANARHEWQRGHFGAAEQCITNALTMVPGDPDATRMLGMVAQRRGDHARAVECFQHVLATWPEDAALRIGLGLSLFEQGEPVAATAQLRQACKLAPDSASARFNLGEALWRQALPAEAQTALEHALRLDPTHVSAQLSLARVEASLGDAEAAIAGFRKVLRSAPGCADAWYGMSLNGARFDASDVRHLQQVFNRTDLRVHDRELCGFTLAKALEDQGDYTGAFDMLQRANALQRAQSTWDATRERARIDAITHAFAGHAPYPLDPDCGHEVILITSLPRSGSTLVEHILASHPDVEGANEIKDLRQVIEFESQRRGAHFPAWAPDATAGDWHRLGREYLARTARWRVSRPRFTDKNLRNWQLVGAALAMLPAARVVVVRRDPVETCLGCFRQCFTEELGFACDIDAMVDRYADFLRLTRLWLDKYPRRVIDLSYEALLDAPEATIRKLLAFCGLGFEPACLAPHKTRRAVLTPSAAQVRQPLRHDTARSAHYGHLLDHLRARLQAVGVTVR